MTKKYSTSDASDRILNVARELFIKNGYDGTSIRDIAAASETNVAHVKYYFGSKYNLFEAIFDEAFDVLVGRVFSVLNSDMPFLELVELWINTYYNLLPEYPQIPIFIMNEINHGSDTLVDKLLKRNPQEVFTKLTERMGKEIKDGTIRDVPMIHFGLNMLSLCIFPFMFRGLAIRIADKSIAEYDALIKEHKQYVVDFVLTALRP